MKDLVQKLEGAKQEINTGKTIHEIYSTQAEMMEALDPEKAKESLESTILSFLNLTKNEFYLLFSKELGYITLFHSKYNSKYNAEVISEFLLYDEGLKALGGLKMYTDEDIQCAMHIYIGKYHFALMPANTLVISDKEEA